MRRGSDDTKRLYLHRESNATYDAGEKEGREGDIEPLRTGKAAKAANSWASATSPSFSFSLSPSPPLLLALVRSFARSLLHGLNLGTGEITELLCHERSFSQPHTQPPPPPPPLRRARSDEGKTRGKRMGRRGSAHRVATPLRTGPRIRNNESASHHFRTVDRRHEFEIDVDSETSYPLVRRPPRLLI